MADSVALAEVSLGIIETILKINPNAKISVNWTWKTGETFEELVPVVTVSSGKPWFKFW